MIAYFDTSAVVPLIVSEPATERCIRLWYESSRIVSVRLLYPEARAAFARANRMGRITPNQLASAVTELDSIITEVDHVEITADLALAAGDLAQSHGLRVYGAVHLATAHAAAESQSDRKGAAAMIASVAEVRPLVGGGVSRDHQEEQS